MEKYSIILLFTFLLLLVFIFHNMIKTRFSLFMMGLATGLFIAVCLSVVLS
jgi:uncharacterized integral membrane protein